MFGALRRDIRTVLERDPAARSAFEVLLFYPGVHALAFHRVAHRLWHAGFTTVARGVSHLGRAPVPHANEDAREVATAVELVHAGAVRVPHEPGVARVEEVLDESGAIPHAAPTGIAARSLRTIGSTDSTT